MEVRTGRAPCAAHRGDRRPGLDLLAGADLERGKMRVARHQPAAVIDLDRVAIAGLAADEADPALGCGGDRRALRAAEIEPAVHRAAAVEGIAAETEARGQSGVGRLDLRQRVERGFERAHPRQAKAEPFEARIEIVIAAGGQPLERTTHRLALGAAQHDVGVEPEHAQSGGGAGGALICKTRHAFDEGKLARFDRGQFGGFGNRHRDLFDGGGGFGIGFAFRGHDHIGRQRGDHVLDEFLPPLQIVGDLVDIVAVIRQPLFGIGDLVLALGEQDAIGRGAILRPAHRPHRSDEGEQRGSNETGGGHLDSRGDGHEADLTFGAHEEFSVGKPAAHAAKPAASGCIIGQIRPRLLDFRPSPGHLTAFVRPCESEPAEMVKAKASRDERLMGSEFYRDSRERNHHLRFSAHAILSGFGSGRAHRRSKLTAPNRPATRFAMPRSFLPTLCCLNGVASREGCA